MWARVDCGHSKYSATTKPSDRSQGETHDVLLGLVSQGNCPKRLCTAICATVVSTY